MSQGAKRHERVKKRLSIVFPRVWLSPQARSEYCHSDHKETIILIWKISVLWLFLLPKRGGIFPYFIDFIVKIEACRDNFCPCKPFFIFSRKIQIVHFIPQSFILWGIVQFMLFIIFRLSYLKDIEFFSEKLYNNATELFFNELRKKICLGFY